MVLRDGTPESLTTREKAGDNCLDLNEYIGAIRNKPGSPDVRMLGCFSVFGPAEPAYDCERPPGDIPPSSPQTEGGWPVPIEATLTRMLRSLGAERDRLDLEIRRLEQIVDQSDELCPRCPPRSNEVFTDQPIEPNSPMVLKRPGARAFLRARCE